MAPDTDSHPPSTPAGQAAPEPHGGDDDPLHNEDVAHEHTDINIRAIAVFLIGLTAVCVFSAVAMWGVFVVLDRQAAKNDPPLSPLAAPAVEMPATTTKSPTFGNAQQGPRLLTNEPAALREHRAHAQKMLDTGEWVDQKAGIARVPIAEAKKALLQNGLPTRAGDPIDPRLGMRPGAMSDPSSGRLATPTQPPRGGPPPTPPKAEHKPGKGH
jgi:hypothetical protein